VQILQHPDIPGDLKSTAFTMLRRLCGTFGRLPRSCLINEDLKTHEEIPFATRGYTNLWKREWKGRKVGQGVEGPQYSTIPIQQQRTTREHPPESGGTFVSERGHFGFGRNRARNNCRVRMGESS